MAVDQHAATARSILERPDDITLWVGGDSSLLEEGDLIGVHDRHGTPEFRCLPGSPLAEAALQATPAVLQATSGLHPGESLTLRGKLRWVQEGTCHCCGEARVRVALDPDGVCLQRDSQSIAVAPASFADPMLQLNVGYLEHSRQHINVAHLEELRAAVANRTGLSVERVVGAQLVRLGVDGVELDWVTPDGAHRESIGFERRAQQATELGDLLYRTLCISNC